LGETLFVHPRSPETVPPPVAAIMQKSLENEAAFGAALEAWLARRPAR
jgi:hypothetical protein